MCDPVTLGIALAASAGGKAINDQNTLSKVGAANAVLGQKIGVLDNLGTQNEGTFNANLANYTPDAQAKDLADAQTARSNTAVGNISNPDQAGANDVPVAGDAPPVVKSTIAKRMLDTYDGAVSRAQAVGKLGGYTDAWFNNNLGNQGAGRNIGYTNDIAEGQKALIGPEQQMAMAATGNSPLGSILQGTGNLMGFYAGNGGNIANAISSYLPTSAAIADPGALI